MKGENKTVSLNLVSIRLECESTYFLQLVFSFVWNKCDQKKKKAPKTKNEHAVVINLLNCGHLEGYAHIWRDVLCEGVLSFGKTKKNT